MTIYDNTYEGVTHMSKRIYLKGVVSIILSLMLSLSVHATTAIAGDSADVDADSSALSTAVSAISGEVYVLAEDADALDAPSNSANVVHTFKAGETVFVTGMEGSYKTVFYQGQTLYLKNASLIVGTIDNNTETEGSLEEEFAKQSAEDAAYIEAFVRQQDAQKRAVIWKIVIGVLVVGLLAISVIIGLRSRKDNTTI